MIEHARGVVTSGIVSSSSVCVCVCVCVCVSLTTLFLNSDTMNERTNSTGDASDASTSRERLQQSFKNARIGVSGSRRQTIHNKFVILHRRQLSRLHSGNEP